ncbi:caspase family protein [Nocardioides taihuensis]|uniref:Caspase domain-containing protein n=1 Tax=Nocardioides taihuensis TaxID=1835606 RepID=A0ABW0BJS5_9ACTN
MTDVTGSRESWKALLVGAAHYDDVSLSDLDGAANNAHALGAALTDPDLGGLPAANVSVLHDPTEPREVLHALADLARDASDVALFYYAGHGLVDQLDGELHLAVGATSHDPALLGWTAVEMSKVHELMRDHCYASTKVLILDCCFSGRAMNQTMSGFESAVTAAVDVAGAVTISSAPNNSPARATPGETYTEFTGALLRHIQTGIPEVENRWLSLDALFDRTQASLQRAGMPRPQILNRDRARLLPLFKNRAHGASVQTSQSAEDAARSLPDHSGPIELHSAFTSDDRRAFREKYRRCLDVFARMLRETQFAGTETVPGIDVIIAAVDSNSFRLLSTAEQLPNQIADPSFRPGPSRSSIRLHISPGAQNLASLESVLAENLRRLEDATQVLGGTCLRIGIAPLITEDDLSPDTLSREPTVQSLARETRAARGEDFRLI